MNYQFNLQPWREQVKQKKQQKFVLTSIFILLAVLGTIGLNYYIEQKFIDNQEEAKKFLDSEIKKLEVAERKVKETKDLIDEINKQVVSIESLQSERNVVLKLLEYIAYNIPDSVFLNHLTLKDGLLTIEGVAESDKGVADFMRMLAVSNLLIGEDLGGIESAKKTDRYEVPENSETKSFTVTAKLNIDHGEGDENN